MSCFLSSATLDLQSLQKAEHLDGNKLRNLELVMQCTDLQLSKSLLTSPHGGFCQQFQLK